MYKILLAVCVTTFFVVSQVAWSQSDGAQIGQLEFDVQPHVVIDRLNKALRSRVQLMAVDWGIEDNHLVITQVNSTLLDREFPHKIRFGENVSVELDSGACPSSNNWNRSTFRLSECFAHHFHVTRHAVGSANDVSRWSSS